MSERRVPRFSAWLFEHLMPGGGHEALEGDLMEELGTGRSVGWYRRQVVGAVVLGWRRELGKHRGALGFAAAWSMLAPVWMALVRSRAFEEVTAGAGRLVWPWSVVCPATVRLSALMGFFWMGLLLFRWWRGLGRRGVVGGWRVGWGSLLVMPLWMGVVMMDLVVQANAWMRAVSACLPFFVAMVCAMWSVRQEADSGRDTEVSGRRR